MKKQSSYNSPQRTFHNYCYVEELRFWLDKERLSGNATSLDAASRVGAPAREEVNLLIGCRWDVGTCEKVAVDLGDGSAGDEFVACWCDVFVGADELFVEFFAGA
jgi:hypothetical protein